MRILLQDAGFVDVELTAYGGVLSFLHHQTSFLLPGLIAGVPVLGLLAVGANSVFSWSLAKLDRLLDWRGLLPLGVIAVATKPA